MFNLFHDLRLAVRQLRRSGSFTATVILTLALGIGLNAAIFTMVDCVLLRPLGYHDADRIYSLNTRFIQENRSIPRVGGDDFRDMAGSLKSIEHAAYYQAFKDGLQTGGRSFFTDIGFVSPQFGQVMGVEPVAGRLFASGPETIDNPSEAMISSSFARENYSSAAQALGQTLTYNGKPRAIVGVLPDGFSFPGVTKVWIEAPAWPQTRNRTSYNQRAIGKVRSGVTAATLNAEMATLSKQLSTAYAEDKFKALEGQPLQELIVGNIRPILRLLMGSVRVVLLIVCANITHLQLVRATQLRREITIRTALGATRSSLARRAALEVLLLAVVGCAAGVMVALPALRLLVQMAPHEIPRLADIHLNYDAIAFSFTISLLTMGAAALLPLWRAWHVEPAGAMKQDSARGLESRSSGRLRQGLVIGEVALTLMLSVAAILLVRQLISESRQDLGFSPENLVVLDTHGSSRAGELMSSYTGDFPPSPEMMAAYQRAQAADLQSLETLLDSIRAVPGVAGVAATSAVPMGAGGSNVGYAIRGVSQFKAPFDGLPNANIEAMTPGYLETMGIPVLRGRGLNAADRAGSEPVLLISESLAKQQFPGQDPVGKQIMCGWDMVSNWWTIVGVVGDVRQDSPASVPYPTIYTPMAQHAHTASDPNLVIRTHADPGAMSVSLAKLMKERFPQVAVVSSTMRANVGESERAQHFRTLLFGCFAGVSILLAMTGMYGVTAYTVAQKRFEFALRFALGAQRPQVLASVMRRALTVAIVGVVGGVGLSLALMRVVSTLLGKMPAFDAVSYGIAAAGVLAIAVLATLVPAFRAATVEPMQVLRSE